MKRSALPLFAVAMAASAVAIGQAGASVQVPEFTVASDQGIVGSFAGFGAQLNQHVYANISGPPPGIPNLEAKVMALGPQFVRIFFSTTEWSFPDRMASFQRTVGLAQRAGAQINITWQGSSFAFAMANMPRFADVLTGVLDEFGISSLWVTLFNEPNSDVITLPQYEQVYRRLDAALRNSGMRDRIHFMGGDLVGTDSPLGQTQADWFDYMAAHMGDLLDAWSIHIYWNFWDTGKIERRLSEVRAIFSAIPAAERRPLYVTEFGARGLPTLEGETTVSPGLWPDGSVLEANTAAAFEEGWLMLRGMQLGYSGFSKWDMYPAQYDNGKQDYSLLGPAAQGWPVRPGYRLLQLLTATTRPAGGETVEVVPGPGADPKKLLTAYQSPAGGLTVFGLDIDGSAIDTTGNGPVAYSVGGLPPNTSFRLLLWNGDGTGTNIDIGYLDSGATGIIQFSAPLHALFALTDTSLGSLPWLSS